MQTNKPDGTNERRVSDPVAQQGKGISNALLRTSKKHGKFAKTTACIALGAAIGVEGVAVAGYLTVASIALFATTKVIIKGIKGFNAKNLKGLKREE